MHSCCTPVRLGGDSLKPTRKVVSSLWSKKAQRCGYLPTPFKILDELRQELDENLFRSSRYNPPTCSSAGSYRIPTTRATTYVRQSTVLHFSPMSTQLPSKILFSECYLMTCTDYCTVLFRMYCVLFILCNLLYLYLLHSPLVICVLKNYLLTYLTIRCKTGCSFHSICKR